MKKLSYVLGFVIVAAVGITAYATTSNGTNDAKTCVVDQNNDEKPCPAGCTCEKCEKAKADAKAEGKEAKADCNKDAKCDKSAKKSCCGSKDATKAEGSTEKKTETTTEKK